MSKKVVVIGGGIIGLSTAYYLHKEGYQVTIIDKSDMKSGASYVNAGYITPSHFIPLAAPGMISKGLKWMFNPSSPFYVKPKMDLDFLQWAWAFKKSATPKKVAKAIPVIKDINLLSRDLYEEIKKSKEFDFQYDRKGLLMCYQSDAVGEAEWEIGKQGIAEGLYAQNLSKAEVKKIEPNVDYNIKGAIYFDCDAHMTPNEYMHKMIAYLKSVGVQFIQESVEDFKVHNGKIKGIKTSKQTITADEFVLAAGTWSSKFVKKLGIKIPLQAGKGYRINTEKPTGITIPAILAEAKVAVTPMKGFTRFAGTMELGEMNHQINPVRVNAIAKAAEQFYNGLKIKPIEISNAKSGLRPCSPDGLPYIGKSEKCNNLTIATGHAMMGWSLGPATGKLVTEVISGKKTSLDLKPFHPDRKF